MLKKRMKFSIQVQFGHVRVGGWVTCCLYNNTNMYKAKIFISDFLLQLYLYL